MHGFCIYALKKHTICENTVCSLERKSLRICKMTLLSIKKLVAWLFEYSSWANKASRAIFALQSGNISLLLKKMGHHLAALAIVDVPNTVKLKNIE
jgi:hypothetical protein